MAGDDGGPEPSEAVTKSDDRTIVERTIEKQQIESGDTTTVHLELSIANETSFIGIHEGFTPAVQGTKLISLPANGDAWEFVATREAFSVFYDPGDTSALDVSSQISLTYEVTATEEPMQHRVTGDLGLIESGEAENETWITTESDTIIVGKQIERYTDEDGIVQTEGLRAAIDDWRAGEVNTGLLRYVIDAWRSGEPIG